ncbi:MAG TPA: hypothetical protein VGN75_05630 [Kaistia sp.]|jgi:hypothetical protein|nr:hypothetical protein [Kaistia sp.]
MGVFDDIRLNWQGTDYVIPANKVMGAIARIEDVITLTEIIQMSRQGRVKFAAIASAYAAVLRYAGVQITDEQVYQGLFKDNTAAIVNAALAGLLQMMLPPDSAEKKDAPQGNAVAPTAAAS